MWDYLATTAGSVTINCDIFILDDTSSILAVLLNNIVEAILVGQWTVKKESLMSSRHPSYIFSDFVLYFKEF